MPRHPTDTDIEVTLFRRVLELLDYHQRGASRHSIDAGAWALREGTALAALRRDLVEQLMGVPEATWDAGPVRYPGRCKVEHTREADENDIAVGYRRTECGAAFNQQTGRCTSQAQHIHPTWSPSDPDWRVGESEGSHD